ncbi:MAG: hypothetical protein Q4B60_08305 [Erysipelotrichaceae bacterium]|nr:hypothetical protein [Erysipelotrichaceae bacterium]
MTNLIVAFLTLLIVSMSSLYIYRKRKTGIKCIGCPCAKSCAGKCHSQTIRGTH